MVKDENVCLHCGLCAERCPTYAWDMRKFVLEHAARGRRRSYRWRRWTIDGRGQIDGKRSNVMIDESSQRLRVQDRHGQRHRLGLAPTA